MAEYREGELIRVEIEGRVVLDDDGRLEISYGSPSVQWGLIVRPDQPGVTVTRVAPPEWPPIPLDVWVDAEGRPWSCDGAPDRLTLPADTRWTPADEVVRDYGPLRLVYRRGGED